MIILHTHLQVMQGGSKMILELCKEFKKKESITIIVDNGKSDFINVFKKNGINIINLKQKSTNSILYWLLLPYYIYKTIKKIEPVLENQKTILSSTFPSHIIAFLLSIKSDISFYAYCFEPFPFFYSREFIWSNGLSKGLLYMQLKIFYSWLDKMAIRRAKKVFTLNRITQGTIKDIYNVNSVVTLMGVDTNHFKYKLNNQIREKYRNQIIVVHSTDYSTMKRTDLAIKALAKAVKLKPNFKLLITSTRPNSPEKKEYQKLAKKLNILGKIEFMSYIEYNELPYYYSMAMCYLSCSYDRMLGTTSSNLPVKESMACETPAIRSDITLEDVEDGKTGYLVDPRNIDKVADKLIQLSELSSLERIKMGKLARKKILKNYNWQKVAGTILHEIN